MKPVARYLLGAAALLCVSLPALPAAPPAEYPTRPIRMLVGFAPGGGVDVMARPIIRKLVILLGQQVIIDNRPGAGSVIAAEIAARAQPDGYTLLVVVPAFAINAAVHAKARYKPTTDFAGVTQIGNASNIISVHPAVAADSVKELVALAKARPLNYGSTGVGTIGHLAGELFNIMAGTHMAHVAYKGGAPVMTDLVAGQIQLIFGSSGTVMPQVKAGRIRALAVTTLTRVLALPDIPTVAESGVPGYEVKNWYGVVVPTRTPGAIVQRLNKAMGSVLAMADVRDALLAQGIDPAPSSPDQFTAHLAAEVAKWGKVVKSAGIRAD